VAALMDVRHRTVMAVFRPRLQSTPSITKMELINQFRLSIRTP